MIAHYLFDCMMWSHKQWSMGKKLGCNVKFLAYIFNNQRGVAELLKYRRTECFKNTFSEVDPTI
jgi:hypothetical protein